MSYHTLGNFSCHVSVQKDNLLVRPQRKNSQVCFLLGFTWFDPFLPNKKIKGFRFFKHVFRICVVQFVLFNACCLFAPPFLKKRTSFFRFFVGRCFTIQQNKPGNLRLVGVPGYLPIQRWHEQRAT